MGDFKIFINFKTYPQGTGERAVELAKICKEVQEGLGGPAFSASWRIRRGKQEGQEIKIIPIVQVADVFRIKQEVNIPVWVQHLDWQEQGQFTGWVNLEAVVGAGASGTLLNHSEHQIPPGMIKQILKRIRDIGGNKGFEVMECCKTLGQMERLVKLKPDFIGYEIEELIGGKISIIDFDPRAIKHAVEICGNIPLVVGAGINTAGDIKKVKDLGATGVLVSSAVMLAENPKSKLLGLLSLLKEV